MSQDAAGKDGLACGQARAPDESGLGRSANAMRRLNSHARSGAPWMDSARTPMQAEHRRFTHCGRTGGRFHQ